MLSHFSSRSLKISSQFIQTFVTGIELKDGSSVSQQQANPLNKLIDLFSGQISMKKQSCPLCQSDATFKLIGEKSKFFTCRQCTEFVITEMAEMVLKRRNLVIRNDFSIRAKKVNFAGMIYVLTGRLPGSNRNIEIEGNARYIDDVLQEKPSPR